MTTERDAPTAEGWSSLWMGAPPVGGGLGLGRLRVSRKLREQVSWWPWYLHPQWEQIGDDKVGRREGGTKGGRVPRTWWPGARVKGQGKGSYTKAALGEGREGGGAWGPHVF